MRAQTISPRFSVGDEVVILGKPFESWRVSELLEGGGDRHLCCVKAGPGPLPGESDTRIERVVAEKELIKLKDALANLLDLAKVPAKNDLTRADLLLALSRAKNGRDLVAPSALIGKLQKIISDIVRLLPRLQEYRGAEPIGYQMHQIGAGIIDLSPLSHRVHDAGDAGATLNVFSSDLIGRLRAQADLTEDSRDSELLKEAAAEIERLRTGAVIVKMPEFLKTWLECLEGVPRTKRGQPPKVWARRIVWEAAAFAFRHSAQNPSGGVNHPFRDFVLEFYKCVTGKVSKTGLTGLIEEVLAEFKEPPELPRDPRELRAIDYAKLSVSELVRDLEVNRSKNTI